MPFRAERLKGPAWFGAEDGAAIEVEVWQLPAARFGDFVAQDRKDKTEEDIQCAEKSWYEIGGAVYSRAPT